MNTVEGAAGHEIVIRKNADEILCAVDMNISHLNVLATQKKNMRSIVKS